MTWAVLILILSLISLSAAGSGNDTESREIAGMNPDSKIADDTDRNSGESTGENLKTQADIGYGTDNRENTVDNLEKISGLPDVTDNQEITGEAPKSRARLDKGVYNLGSVEKSLKAETEIKKDTGSQENPEKNPEIKEVESNSIDNQEGPEASPETKTEIEQDTDNQQNVERNLDTGIGEERDTENKENIEKNPETGIRSEKSTDNHESARKDPETEKVESCSTDNRKYPYENPAQKEETKETPRSQVNSESNLKLKTSTDNEKCSSGSSQTKTEIKTGSRDGSKHLKITEAETELKEEGCSRIKSFRSCGLKPETKIKAFSGEKNLKSDHMEAQVNIGRINWTHVPGSRELKAESESNLWLSFPLERLWNKELRSEESGESSWNNLKFILSYPCSLRSYYNTHESVKINYRGSKALRGQKVDVYLVKARSPGFSEETVNNITDGNTVRFEDIFDKNTEFYIQIPATLNEAGNLSPLTLGPLPEGSYWVLITLAGSETKAPEPEKNILLANYFEVLKYEMEAEAPHTLEEGENFEVNLSLKNVPAQEDYIYWAVLISEDACGTGANTGSETSGTNAVAGTFANGLKLIRDFGLNSTNSESETGKDNLKSKFQALIGEGNSTISIGEENQSNLSVNSLGLAPGKYWLFAGAYEKDRRLAGMAQEELTISPAREEDPYPKSYSGDGNSSGSISKGQSPLLPGS